MQLIDGDGTIQSFVIRIWLEEPAADSTSAVWRGHITHVASKRKVYVKEIADLMNFIIPYLHKMGVEVDGEMPPKEA